MVEEFRVCVTYVQGEGKMSIDNTTVPNASPYLNCHIASRSIIFSHLITESPCKRRPPYNTPCPLIDYPKNNSICNKCYFLKKGEAIAERDIDKIEYYEDKKDV